MMVPVLFGPEMILVKAKGGISFAESCDRTLV